MSSKQIIWKVIEYHRSDRFDPITKIICDSNDLATQWKFYFEEKDAHEHYSYTISFDEIENLPPDPQKEAINEIANAAKELLDRYGVDKERFTKLLREYLDNG